LKRIVRRWLEALEDLKAKLDEFVSVGGGTPARVPKLVPVRVRSRYTAPRLR
jgi:hypothetical protein